MTVLISVGMLLLQAVLFAEGCSTKDIASKLDISPRTVEYHKYQMMDSLKLGASAELIHFAIKHGIVAV